MSGLSLGAMIRGELLVSEGLANVRKKYLDTGVMDAEVFNGLLDADPTPQKKYVDWMFKHVFNTFKDPEGRVQNVGPIADTVSKLKTTLNQFDQGLAKGFIVKKDIHQYKSISELYQTVEEIANKTSKTQQKKEERYDEADKVYEDDKYLIVSPKSWEGCKIWGKGARWCIGYEDNSSYWNSYTHRDRLKFYFIINKQSDPRNDPMAKVALGINEHDQIQEAFDAPDHAIDDEKYVQQLQSEGVPTGEIFVWDGWEEYAEEDMEKAVAEVEKRFQALIDDAELEHGYVEISSDYMDEGISPEDAIYTSAGYEIEIPEELDVKGGLENVDGDVLDEIQGYVEDFSDFSIEETHADDSIIRLHINHDGHHQGEDLIDSLIDDIRTFDSKYEEIQGGVLTILARNGHIEGGKYESYAKIFDEIEESEYGDREDGFRNFKNIEFETYDNNVRIDFSRIGGVRVEDITALHPRIRSNGGRIEVTEANMYTITTAVVKGIMATGGHGSESYDPRQMMLKDVLPDASQKFTEKQQFEVQAIFADSPINLWFHMKEHDGLLVAISMEIKVGVDLELVVNYLETVEANYNDLAPNLVDSINRSLNGKPASLVNTSGSIMGEHFDNLVEKYLGVK